MQVIINYIVSHNDTVHGKGLNHSRANTNSLVLTSPHRLDCRPEMVRQPASALTVSPADTLTIISR